MKFARDGWLSIGVMSFLTAVAWIFVPVVGLLLLVPTAVVAWFYRDPDRTPDGNASDWVSPADGKVVEIESASHPFCGETIKIGIFMNPLDVHVNRVPVAGKVLMTKYVPGKRLMAFDPKASENNERFYVGLETEQGRTVLVQIAGFLARRIAMRVKYGDTLDKGQRYGMIKFGSKVDVYLPPSVKPSVVIGQRVLAGKTSIGVIQNETA